MITNRSVPTNTVLPHVTYRDVGEAIEWLGKTFGFEEHYRNGAPHEPPSGVQMHLGSAWIMLHQAQAGRATPLERRFATQNLTVFVDYVDAHYEKSQAQGAKIFAELEETIYGERQYGVEDLAGHRWLFSQHARDLSPSDWGATIAKPAYRLALLPRPRVCYLEIPANNLLESITFYEKVFGWNIRGRETSHPSFDDATGDVSGAWTLERKSAAAAWITSLHLGR